MLVAERRERVLELVGKSGFARLAELASGIGVSESTLRRDLDYWEGRKRLKRTHGGAMVVGDAESLPALEERSATRPLEKRQIAAAAAARIRDGETVLLDGGTTTLELAKLLVGRPLQVVTNSLPVAQLLAASRETDLVLLGGYVYPRTGVALGPLTMKQLADVRVHRAVMSVSGITAAGLFNSNLLLVETQRGIMKCADEVVVVADSSKFGRSALVHLCELAAIDTLVSDGRVPPEYRRLLKAAGVRLVAANGKKGKGAKR